MEGYFPQPYIDIIEKVLVLYKSLKLNKVEKHKGRKLAISIPHILALSLFKQQLGIATKKAVYEIIDPNCSYKTMVVNMNRFSLLALVILIRILKENEKNQHLIKHTDSTDIPVCLNKNARFHKTMKEFSSWGHTGKGYFFGLKLHLTADLDHNVLAIKFTSANISDKGAFMDLNKHLKGIFIADSGYVSKQLEKEFYIENERILFVKPRSNMKKIATDWQNELYDTRFQIEFNFRNIKLFYEFITSLPRSVNGYLANYIYSLTAYLIKKFKLLQLKDQAFCLS